MARRLDDVLREFARQSGEQGFTFDDLCTAALESGSPLSEVADWLARRSAAGDLTLIEPRRYGLSDQLPETKRIDLRLPAEPRTVGTMRWAAGEFARRNGIAASHPVELAVSEAVTNVVLHAYPAEEPGEVRLVSCAEPERIVVVVRDWGSGGMRPRVGSPGLGVGLPTMAQMASSFNIETPDGGGTLVRMHFALD